MDNRIILIYLILLAHVLGDFYSQTNNMAEKKKNQASYVFCHSIFYALTIAVTFLATLEKNTEMFQMIACLAIAHMMIDYLKFYVASNFTIDAFHSFCIDQVAHLLAMGLIWYYYKDSIVACDYVCYKVPYLPCLPLAMILATLIVLKPASCFIMATGLKKVDISGGTTEEKKAEVNEKEDEEKKSDANGRKTQIKDGTGKKIGYCERLLILCFLMYGKLDALGFVIAAKSISRFSEIKENTANAEYYIFGTLISMVIVVVVAILLGVCPLPQ